MFHYDLGPWEHALELGECVNNMLVPCIFLFPFNVKMAVFKFYLKCFLSHLLFFLQVLDSFQGILYQTKCVDWTLP